MSDINSQIDAFGNDIVRIISNINYNPLCSILANIVRNSIEENFASGGRYGNGLFGGGNQKWQPSRRAKKEYYTNESGQKQDGKTLQSSGQLAASIRVKANAVQGGVNIEIGSNKKYAMIHQFGGVIQHPGGTPYISLGSGLIAFVSKKKAETLKSKGKSVKLTKAHSINIPARPYLVLQEEDINMIQRKFGEYIAKVLG